MTHKHTVRYPETRGKSGKLMNEKNITICASQFVTYPLQKLSQIRWGIGSRFCFQIYKFSRVIAKARFFVLWIYLTYDNLDGTRQRSRPTPCPARLLTGKTIIRQQPIYFARLPAPKIYNNNSLHLKPKAESRVFGINNVVTLDVIEETCDSNNINRQHKKGFTLVMLLCIVSPIVGL